ncbi:ArsR/SmtB family transcription factor [Fluviicola taffensis]|uniref:Regulatory protein ArsR n=1 Tax=Fluviicola taffensis (strain DSM 16823 / NCIMB 13979 / RW262) TaxID=755732 RepID=F2IF95_FLUTR|nr:winged helix-turn-helix domain-containing protein [Fluviicola taffensis]AEA43569.1 regulatory protein ArsR [Fluviicola taffensis DSM 16823]
MGSTKKEQYTRIQLDYAGYTKALGHPARISIVEYLNHYPRGKCREFVRLTKLSRSTISQHLNELINAGVVFERYDDWSNDHYYFLNPRARDLFIEIAQIFCNCQPMT